METLATHGLYTHLCKEMLTLGIAVLAHPHMDGYGRMRAKYAMERVSVLSTEELIFFIGEFKRDLCEHTQPKGEQ